MFSKQTYLSRRNELKRLVGSGVIILFGNNESPCNYPSNAYSPFRQDSSFLYYFGLAQPGLVGVIDVDNDSELLFGDDIDIEDIVWYGSVDSVSQMAASVGVARTAPMSALNQLCSQARAAGRTLHFLPPYRHDTMLTITDLLGIHHSRQRDEASLTLIRAVVKMRSSKTAEEVVELEKAAEIGYQMHTTAMRLARPGVTEKYVGGQVDGIARSLGAQVSFATIFSQHGEIMHGNPSMALLEEGRLALCDAGAETMSHYCSDNTRTFPFLRVMPTEANYFLCEVLPPYRASEIVIRMLKQHNILTRDCSEKPGLPAGKQYMRIAVRNHEDNCRLVEGLKQIHA